MNIGQNNFGKIMKISLLLLETKGILNKTFGN